ncbi:diaminopimelate epimerase [Metapseudomonas resinovorans]|uniref:diaminopimelate epimerase n=1 Tax=Metapseudomonas resinovorans TaxID=53412 RepID=UPI000985CE44|nr:diaminopimelate epimerase [Pseudomonas resinovorans]GLZ86326.1 diaminopimelate epimerase [Pseudomonas resinovorans]
MDFFKYHAASNDYLVYADEPSFDLSPAEISRTCDRHRGLGADGILVPVLTQGEMPSVIIYNTDGSQAEKSGNGLRIFCRYLWDRGHVGAGEFQVHTAGGVVSCQVLDEGRNVAIRMGRAQFPDRSALEVNVQGRELRLHPVSMGNPHCVIFMDQPDESTARALGPVIEHLEPFPNRTNVQFVKVIDRNNLEVRIWERGVGYTLSSGTSSCAAAAVCRRLGLVEPEVNVHMPGGLIQIVLDENFEVLMRGPVRRVGRYSLDEECFS